MMRYTLPLAIVITAFFHGQAWAGCSTTAIPQSKLKLVGKSYDWHQDTGYVTVNKRHVQKSSVLAAPGDKAVKWVSRYGSLTFNQYGREFPLGGINEKGLVVEIMWLKESVYPKVDGRQTLNELQWIQYQLDNFATVAEAVKDASLVRVSKIFAPVHYLACDRQGECATFEYLDGELVIHTGKELVTATLTNSSYEDSADFLTEHVGFGGEKAIPKGTESLDRFARAAALSKQYTERSPEKAIQYVFDLLHDVRQGDYSKFNIVYETAGHHVHFRTLRAGEVKHVDLSRLDYSCRTPVKMLDINTSAGGDADGRFVDYTAEANLAQIKRVMTELVPYLPKGSLEKLAAFPESTRCLD
jgi:choloylglycine hydrolase